MTHFGLEASADFARRNLPPAEELSMQDHLDSGCRDCVEALQVWLGVLEVATGLDVYSPPEGGLGFVKALYRAFPPSHGETGRIDVARLVIPTGATAVEGLRGTTGPRHFVFQRGNVLLDVEIDVDQESGAISLAGQLMDPIAPGSRFSERSVIVLSEDAEVARTETNAFGEFHLGFSAVGDLILVIQLEPGSMLVTPLPSFVIATTTGLKENDATN